MRRFIVECRRPSIEDPVGDISPRPLAQGVQFASGRIALHRLDRGRGTCIYHGIDDVEREFVRGRSWVHIVWVDPEAS